MSFFDPPGEYKPTKAEIWIGNKLKDAFTTSLAAAGVHPVWTMMGPLKAAIDADDATSIADILKKCSKAARGEIDDLEEVPLRYALKNEKYAAAKTLLAHDASLMLDRDYFGRQALADLAGPITGDEEKTKRILAFLLDAGAAIDDAGKEGRTALGEALSRGDIAVAAFLIDRGANVNTRDQWQQTPLMDVAGFGRGEAVKLLLDHGADINAVSEHGYTPATCAAHAGYYDVALSLMRQGGKVNFGAQNFDHPGRDAKPEKDTEFIAALNAQKAEWDETQKQAAVDEAVHEIEGGIDKPVHVHAIHLKGTGPAGAKRGFSFRKS